ncbi:MAG: glycosyltransferase family 4 protein, partial [Candidatus Hodarchaeota archaeon]
VVSVILDLQHQIYPQFFSPQEIAVRDSFLCDVRRKADRIICISENVRQSALKHLKVDPKRTYVVPICIQSRLHRLKPDEVNTHLASLGIDRHPYMFYPANFWPHKNHRMLLTAYGMFLSRNPDKKIDLAFTGVLGKLQEELKDAVRRMGLAKQVHFLGFLPQEQLTAVWQGCEFLIFPSLYEGFGIPVLEAMSFGKPVLCSNATSLPEIAGDAALYFDPRKPGVIVRCLEEVVMDPTVRGDLVSRGYERVASFRTEDMTNKYLEIFRSAIRDAEPFADVVKGVYDDGWIGEEMVITYSTGPKSRVLESRLEAPSWLPAGRIKLKLRTGDGNLREWQIRRGKEVIIRHPLPEHQGFLILSVAPTFRPSECEMGGDSRSLGIICRGCWLISPEQERKSLLMGDR